MAGVYRPGPTAGIGWPHARLPGRRHLRAVPPLLRRAPAPHRRGGRGGGHPGRAVVHAAAAGAGRDPPRRGHRPRDRVVPQRPVARLQASARASTRPLLASSRCSRMALEAMGVVVWPMVEVEADDALASAAAVAADDPAVEQVVICTPDKDLGQCVRDGRVVQLDRRRQVVYDEAGVTAKFGVAPGLHPRLPGPGRRLGRRLPGPARLGSQVGRGRARPLRHHRADPRRPRRVGGTGPQPPRPGRHPARAAPPGDAVQGPGHPAGRPHPARRPGQPPLDRPDTDCSPRSAPASTPAPWPPRPTGSPAGADRGAQAPAGPSTCRRSQALVNTPRGSSRPARAAKSGSRG